MPTLESPNVMNYYVGKGIVSIQLAGEPSFIDVGNVPEFELTPNVERLDHFSSRAGVRSKDRSIVLEKGMTLRMVMEEWSARNLGMALMGAVNALDPSNVEIDILSQSEIIAAVRFTGTNDVGPKWTFELPRVEFTPSAAMNLISEEWAPLEITGEVLFDEGTSTFGTATADFTPTGS